LKKVLDIVKSLDNFGKPISLTYNGETEFKTLYGGILTIWLLSYMVLISYAFIEPLLTKEIDKIIPMVEYN